MKSLTNWRYWVLTALFTAGSLCVALAFGEDARSLKEWAGTHLLLFFVGVGLLRASHYCAKLWGINPNPASSNKISE